jgi:hypothetical protein
MTVPEAEDPQASADYRPKMAPPMSDGFYRAISEYVRAENAKAEPEPEPEAGPETVRDYVADLVADAERARLAREAEAELGHDYKGREAQPGTPEHDKVLEEYLEWTNSVQTPAEYRAELDAALAAEQAEEIRADREAHAEYLATLAYEGLEPAAPQTIEAENELEL